MLVFMCFLEVTTLRQYPDELRKIIPKNLKRLRHKIFESKVHAMEVTYSFHEDHPKIQIAETNC